MPYTVTFTIDKNVGYCSSQWLTWNGQGTNDADKKDSAKSTFALLLSAVTSNKTVRVYGINDGCRVQFIHILNN